MRACHSGDGKQVKELLTLGSARPDDMTPNNDTPLSIAIWAGFEEIVQLLLEKGANPNLPCGKFQTSPLQIAIVYEQPNIARRLLRHGADQEYHSARGWSVLHHMFHDEKIGTKEEFFSMLSSLPFDGVKDGDGWTCLHRCAAYGTTEDIHALHLRGAARDVSLYTNNMGRNPIHIAALMNNVATLEALVKLQKVKSGVWKAFKKKMKILDCVDNNGWTAMHLAVRHKAWDTMKCLLQNGADPHLMTYGTADWFPQGHEGQRFKVEDVANLSGKGCFRTFFEGLEEAGHDVTTDGEDIYWSCDDNGDYIP